MPVTQSLKNLFPLCVLLLGLLGYNFMNAQWSGPSANPPGNNVEAPINVGTSTDSRQPGAGTILFDRVVAFDQMRSDLYCDSVGQNCVSSGGIGGGGLGEGQTWVNVLSSRTRNVWYQNTTGKPISVYVWVSPGDGLLYANTRGVDAGQVLVAGPDNDSGTRDNLFAIIPDGHWYKQTGRGADAWSELR